MNLVNRWRTLLGLAFVVVLLLTNSHPARAARIYNFLVGDARVMPFVDIWDEISLPTNPSGWDTSGCRSGSLSWIATQVNIQSPVGHFVCYFDWWTRQEITGGNYMTIGQRGRDVICTLCNADHQAIGTSSGRLPDYYPARDSYTGC